MKHVNYTDGDIPFEVLSAKESLFSGYSVAITMIFGLAIWPFLLVWHSHHRAGDEASRSLNEYIPIVIITSVVAILAVSVIMYLNIRKQRIVKQHKIVSLARTIIDGIVASTLVILPIAATHYGVIITYLHDINRMPGHSVGAEYFVPIIYYVVLILPAFLLQIITTLKINRQLRRMKLKIK